MKKSKSKLIIGISIILVIAIIAIGGTYLYLTTDLFKGNDQLFFKYLAKNGEAIKQLTSNDEMLNENITKNKYKEEAEMTFNIESSDTQIANQSIPAGNFNIKYFANVDPESNKKSSETTLRYLTTDLFTLKYIRNNDLYALKSDEVVNKYLALDNNNLKEFATKFGIEDTSLIPNKIEQVNFKELFSITEEQQKAVLQKCLEVINTQISKDKYKSQKDVEITVNNQKITANAYSLELTQKEAIKVLTSFLEAIKNDDTMLNVVVDKINLLNKENPITINEVKDMLQNVIDNLNSIQAINEETIKITVYASNGKLVRTEISVGEDLIYIDTEKNDTSSRVVISFEKNNELLQDENNDLFNDEDMLYGDNEFSGININLKKLELAKQTENNQNTDIAIVTLKSGEETIKVSLQSKTTINESIENNTIVNINVADNTYVTAKIDSKKVSSNDIVVEELTKENSATINNFTPQYIENLSQAISNRIQELFVKKLEIVNTQINMQNNNNNQEENSGIIEETLL